ncbi:MAG: purine-nucleoside phosphorylase [Gorillibacterium sp.]|nr:purine-nucleoside phosphorylase [Gorillibacterium sp.]
MTEQTTYLNQIEEAANYLRNQLSGRKPQLGLILGSGLGDLADHVEDAVYIDYKDVPHFPESTVVGHAGRFVAGKLDGKDVLVMQGRIHFYEGYDMRRVVFPVYVMHLLGIANLVITNAAGGLNRGYAAGDLMLISDHLNLTGANPLIGHNHPELGLRFPDMSEAYTRSFRELAKKLAADVRGVDGEALTLREGVYSGISGPSYMTPAELTMLARMGGDAVGMSTVAEVVAASHARMRVLGISCITDMAIGDELEPLTHEQVMATAERAKPKFQALIRSFVKEVQL